MEDLEKLRAWLREHVIAERKAIDPINRFCIRLGLIKYPTNLDSLVCATLFNIIYFSFAALITFGLLHQFVQPLLLTPVRLIISFFVLFLTGSVFTWMQRRAKKSLGIPDRSYFSSSD